MGLAPAPALVPRPARVRRTRRETADTVTLELDVEPRPAFQPGQFAMLYVFGIGEVPISFSGSPHASRPIAFTIREAGAVTRALGRLRRGDTLGVRGPYGHPWPLHAAAGADVLVVAGGIGLAPLRSALLAIARRRRAFGCVTLLYGARTPGDLLFAADRSRWQRSGRIDVLVTVDHATRDWSGRVGVVPALVPELPLDVSRTRVLMCGPEVMMRFTAKALRDRGVPDAHLAVSLERNMQCAVGLCGHCQLGSTIICRDGPVYAYDRVRRMLEVREL
jgi:NAD(P)H-flavin reductase